MQGEEHNDIASLHLIMRRIELSCSSIQVDATAQSQVKTTLAKLEEQMNSVELKLDRVLHLLENSTEPNSGHVGDIGESPMKGKRSAENEIEKAVSAKKQKVARGETVVPDDSDLNSHPKDKSVVKEQPVTVTVSKKTIIADSSSESDTDDDEEEKEAAVQTRKAQRRPTQSKAPKDSSSSEECDECDSDEEEEKKKAVTHPKNAQEKPTQSNTPNHSSSSEESDSDEEPQTTPSPKAKESKTLFVENLSFDVKESQVREFFKNAVDVRLSTVAGMCKGFGHVEFATAEAAKQAMKLNTQPLLGCRVKLKLAS